MFSFNDEVKSMDILKKTKNIIKERNCYGKFIKCYDHHKLKKYCYNGKLKKVPKLLLNERKTQNGKIKFSIHKYRRIGKKYNTM